MAHKTFKDMAFRMDNASGTLAALTQDISSQELNSILSLLEDTAMADTEHQYLPGLAGATLALAGFWNTTVDAIFGPLIGNDTSITKTVEFRAYASPSNRFYNGEVLLSNIRVSGAVDGLETFSADMTFDGAVNRTSVAL